MQCYTRESFMEEYAFPLKPAKDFERAGIPAQYASGHPKEWSQTRDVINFSADLPQQSEITYRSYDTAVSSDKKLLAISSNLGRILVYNIHTRQLCEILEGGGSVEFRPSVANAESHSEIEQTSGTGTPRPGYTLVSSVVDETQRSERTIGQLILWDLDQNGRTLDKEEPIDPSVWATKAIDAIAPELAANHEWTREFIDGSSLHTEFLKALSHVAADYNRRHNTIIDNAELGGFGSKRFSKDGRLMLYRSNNHSTQSGMRPAEDLPLVVIYDVEAGKEMHRLTGHTDAIMWSAMSPDMECVATVSWDGSLRMYSVSTGVLIWATDKSGGQSWAGAFSPDSKLIVWSTKSGSVVQVHDVLDGRKVAVMPEKFSRWCRCFDWHPARSEIALCAGKEAYVWNPLDGSNGKVLQHFKIEGKERLSMSEIHAVLWMNEGRLLGIESDEGSTLIYDTESNAKELFWRPAGTMASYVAGSLCGMFLDKEEQDVYLSVDGDGTARFWRTSVPALPSWWDKDPIPVATKKAFPETGKYVKITKTSGKATLQHEAAKES
ncbi:uncharacterized protein J4E92_008271 [Alternaria infectoria]|uniref:uncharacterized protein n=1 Tax=Alternaria infectoria TaxID=45303 RepID=UPI00221FFD3F|nr:uncharacterized protein J4E92_008271 [Alternaria infectoria]KAI4920628.1 hypothetical protein J4E92_008271 [Alternaria infectoria]